MPKFLFFLMLVFLSTESVTAQNRHLDSLYVELGQVQIDSQRVIILNEIAFNNIAIDPIVAKDDVVIAYDKAQEINFERGSARSLVVMGGVYWAFGNYDKSLSHYLEALKIYQNLEDFRGRSDCLNNIGEVYKKLGEYNNALDYLTHALSVKEKIDGRATSALIYNNLGELYALMGEFDKAEEYYSIAINAAKEKDDKRVLAYSIDGLGTLYLERGEYDKSILNFKQAFLYRDELNDLRGASYALFNLGRAYFQQNMLDSAEYYFEKGLINAQKSSAVDVKMSLYQSLSILDSVRNNYKKAFGNFVQYSLLKDSIYNDTKSSQIARMQAEYEIELLRKDNESQNVAVKQRNTLIIGVIMLLLLTLALTYTFNNQRKYQKKANEILHTKNEQIASQNLKIQSQAVNLKSLNDNLANLNENLEDKIRFRTKLLEVKNQELADYAFIHAHELRAPLSNILGLVQLLKHSNLSEKDKEMIEHLYLSTAQLDQVIQKIASKESEEDFKTKP